MATENIDLSYFNNLTKFRNKELEDVEGYLRDVSVYEYSSILNSVMLEISILQEKDEIEYEIKKQYIKYFYGLLPCTLFELEDEDYSLENYDVNLEQKILDKSLCGKKLYEMIDNIIRKRELGIINDLYNQFNNLPSPEEIKALQDGFDDLFKSQSEEKLSIVESILQYNDPNMKALKESISAPLKKGAIEKDGDKKQK